MKVSVFFDHVLQAQEQTGKPLEELLKGVRQAGIEAVEINLDYLNKHMELLELLGQNGIKVSCIYEFYDMGHREESEKIHCHLETALKAGAERILVVPGFLEDDEAERMQNAIQKEQTAEEFFGSHTEILRMKEGLAQAAEYGKEKGVLVTVEDFDDRNSPLSGMHGIHWFLKQIPELAYTLDTGNYLFYGESVLEAMELLKKRIVHVHCKDRRSGDNASVRIGSGYIPFGEILEKLRVQGYDGYFAVEHFDVPEQEVCIRQSVDFLKKLV